MQSCHYFKKTREIHVLKPVLPGVDRASLMPGDSLFFGFRLPPAKKDRPEYLRALVRTYQMPWGLNGSAQKLDR